MSARAKPPLQHHLISLLTPYGNMHSYLVCDNNLSVERCCGEMINIFEKQGVVVMPMFMDTILDEENSKKVRKYVNEIVPESIETMAKMTNLHRTTWLMLGADEEWLLALH